MAEFGRCEHVICSRCIETMPHFDQVLGLFLLFFGFYTSEPMFRNDRMSLQFCGARSGWTSFYWSFRWSRAVQQILSRCNERAQSTQASRAQSVPSFLQNASIAKGDCYQLTVETWIHEQSWKGNFFSLNFNFYTNFLFRPITFRSHAEIQELLIKHGTWTLAIRRFWLLRLSRRWFVITPLEITVFRLEMWTTWAVRVNRPKIR